MQLIPLTTVEKVEIVFNRNSLTKDKENVLKKFGILSRIACWEDGDTIFYGKYEHTTEGWNRKVQGNKKGETRILLSQQGLDWCGTGSLVVGFIPGNRGLMFTSGNQILCIKLGAKAENVVLPPGGYVVYVYIEVPKEAKRIAYHVEGRSRITRDKIMLQRVRLSTYLKKPGVSSLVPSIFFKT